MISLQVCHPKIGLQNFVNLEKFQAQTAYLLFFCMLKSNFLRQRVLEFADFI